MAGRHGSAGAAGDDGRRGWRAHLPALAHVSARGGIRGVLEARRLLAFLEWFLPIEADWVPDNSILREFLGDSILKNFNVWGG